MLQISNNEIDDLLKLIKSSSRVFILSHVHPDGDAYGSSLALCHALRATGYKADCVDLEPTPDEYAFLQYDSIDYNQANDNNALYFVLDLNSSKRLPPNSIEIVKSKKIICVDHHLGESDLNPIMKFVAEEASSTSELVYDLIKALALPINQQIAEALWTGIITDTGRLAYDSTSHSTLAACAELIKYGVRTAFINSSIFESVNFRRLKLQKHLLEHLKVTDDGLISYSYLSSDDYKSENCIPSDSENFVDIVRSVKNSKISFFLRKSDDDKPLNLSVRTKDPYNAATICTHWNGGGHQKAAGATFDMPLDKAIEDVLSYIKEYSKSV